MIAIDHLGNATPAECLLLLKAFIKVEDERVREGIIALTEELSENGKGVLFLGEAARAS